MSLTNAGRNLLATGMIGGSVTFFTNAAAAIAVGTGDTAFAATQTDMISIGNNARQGMDATYPLAISGNILRFSATFSTAAANFPWAEWGVTNSSSTGVGTLLNRKVESLGTKTSSQSWNLVAELTVNNP